MKDRHFIVRESIACLSVAVLAWLYGTAAAAAEVSDKELSVAALWSDGALGAVVGFLAARYRPWGCLLSVPLLLAPQLVATGELLDPFVGPALRAESGGTYTRNVVGSAFLVLAGHGAGLLRRRLRRTRQANG